MIFYRYFSIFLSCAHLRCALSTPVAGAMAYSSPGVFISPTNATRAISTGQYECNGWVMETSRKEPVTETLYNCSDVPAAANMYAVQKIINPITPAPTPPPPVPKPGFDECAINQYRTSEILFYCEGGSGSKAAA